MGSLLVRSSIVRALHDEIVAELQRQAQTSQKLPLFDLQVLIHFLVVLAIMRFHGLVLLVCAVVAYRENDGHKKTWLYLGKISFCSPNT